MIVLREGPSNVRSKGVIRGVGNAQDRGPSSLELTAKGHIVFGEVRGQKNDVHGVSSISTPVKDVCGHRRLT
jgi:hypothetical protein